MAAATPTVETVLTAVKTAMDAISPSIGTVYNGFHTLEDDVEFLLKNSHLSSGSFDVFFIDLLGIEEQEEAAGEHLQFYNILIVYWCLRTNDSTWSKTARQKAEAVRDALTGASSIFAIGSQRQLVAPETVKIGAHGVQGIRGADGQQMVYQTVLTLTVEGRRFL